MAQNTSDMLSFLRWYLSENAAIKGLVGGANNIVVKTRGLLIDPLLKSENNSTQTCIRLSRISKIETPFSGMNWNGHVKYDLVLEARIFSLASDAYAESVAQQLSDLLLKGIQETYYNGLSYGLIVKNITSRSLDEENSEIISEILTITGWYWYTTYQ